MSALPVEPPQDVVPGDVITLTATVKRVRLDGHVAVCETVYGDVWIPLPGPNVLRDPLVVVVHAPAPQQVTEVRAAGCVSCGR